MIKNICRKKIQNFGNNAEDYSFWYFVHFMKHRIYYSRDFKENVDICSSVPAHVEMVGFMGMGNNLMVGCTVACAVSKKNT